jgi:hypothetical protein
MHGNFDEQMTLIEGGVTVCGPIFWNGTTSYDLPATRLEVDFVLVVQGPGGRIVGHVAPGTIVTPPETEWMLDVPGDFHAGPANALAVVRLVIAGRKRITTETWSETIAIS